MSKFIPRYITPMKYTGEDSVVKCFGVSRELFTKEYCNTLVVDDEDNMLELHIHKPIKWR